MESGADPVFVLIHSPLVGSITWTRVAGLLRRKGMEAVVPAFSDELAKGQPFYARIAARVHQAVSHLGTDRPLILVGHSGAGALLPVIREQLSQPVRAYLFVDARLPKNQASFFSDVPADLAAAVREMARDGWLPAWSDWFGGEEALRELLPEDALRRRFLADQPAIPIALLEERTPVPPTWPDAPCGYLQLSDAYQAEAAKARSAGWPTGEIGGNHLQMLVDPAGVAEKILDLWLTEMAGKDSSSDG